VIFNPHGFDVEELVRINRHADGVVDAEGNTVPSQLSHSTVQECFHREDIIFKAKVPALGYAVYYLQGAVLARGADFTPYVYTGESSVKATAFTGRCTANNHEGTVLENEFYRINFELYSGYITSFIDKTTGEELISGRAAMPVVVDEYYHDCWSHAKNFFTDTMARFSDAKVTVVENGPVRATVKVVSRYNDSTLTQYFSLEAGSKNLKVKAVADWHEKYKMLKLAWPMKVENPKAYYEIPFGVIERPADGEEEPGLTWTAVKGDNAGYAILNNNTYSSSVKDGTIYQTLLRSPIFGDHGGPRDEESEFTSQGRMEFAYEWMPVTDSWAPVVKAARQLNKPLSNIVENWHEGPIKELTYGAIKVDKDNIILSACKRSEDGTGMILRLYEVDGVTTEVTVSGDVLPTALKATFTPYSVNTYYLADGSKEWKEVLLTEYDI